MPLYVKWSATSNDLESVLGLAGTETFSASGLLTASDEHRYGWYPGTISFGTTQGEGLAEDTEWVPQETETRAVSGSGQMRCVRPSRDIHHRTLRFDLIGRTERADPYRGVAMMDRYAVDRTICWYPDRADGDVGSTGTQGDPHDDPRDSSCDYWLVTLVSRPRVDGSGKHPDWFSVELGVNGEPD
jgi:hypothetical protein